MVSTLETWKETVMAPVVVNGDEVVVSGGYAPGEHSDGFVRVFDKTPLERRDWFTMEWTKAIGKMGWAAATKDAVVALALAAIQDPRAR